MIQLLFFFVFKNVLAGVIIIIQFCLNIIFRVSWISKKDSKFFVVSCRSLSINGRKWTKETKKEKNPLKQALHTHMHSSVFQARPLSNRRTRLLSSRLHQRAWFTRSWLEQLQRQLRENNQVHSRHFLAKITLWAVQKSRKLLLLGHWRLVFHSLGSLHCCKRHFSSPFRYWCYYG